MITPCRYLATLLTSTALLSVAVAATATPVFQITVKKVLDKQEKPKVAEAKPEAPAQKFESDELKEPIPLDAEPEPEKPKPVKAQTAASDSLQAPLPLPEYDENLVEVVEVPTGSLAPIDIKTVFDGLEVKPLLNVYTTDRKSRAVRGEGVTIEGVWNYSAFTERGEVRVFKAGTSTDGEPLEIVALNPSREAVLETSNGDLPDELIYVLRVYDADGRFDQTKPRPLTLVENELPNDDEPIEPILADLERDYTASRAIDVAGGTVTVRGSYVADGEEVTVLGNPVKVSADGEFEVREILPFGDHTVPVEVAGPRAKLIEREMRVPESEWFMVGHLDVTVGENIADTTQPRSGNIDVIGRGGLYLKGKIKGKYLVTAAVDTQEDEVDNLLSNITKRRPNGLLNRIDPNKYYPVFGDSSSITEDAPTRSNLYVRIDRGDDHIMWGSYDVNIGTADLITLNRGLYGAKAHYSSDAVTSRGEAKTQATVFAASLDTAANYEVLTGTGGTVYRLARQDVLAGTVRLQVEIRNRTTGKIINTIALKEGVDYTIDYLQGRIILARPLSGSIQNGNAAIGIDDDLVLAARYEYAPQQVDINGYTFAGRATHWVTDNIRIGATGQSENSDGDRRNVYGADLLIKPSAGSWLKAEVGQSEGVAPTLRGSIDGGISFDNAVNTSTNSRALAYRVETSIDLEEVSSGKVEGAVTGYFEHFDQGYAGRIRRNNNRTENWGGTLLLGSDDAISVRVSYDETKVETEGRKRLVSGKLQKKLNKRWTASLAATYDWVQEGSTFAPIGLTPLINRSGHRADVTARLDYEFTEDKSAYVYGTATASKSGNRRSNNRLGIGGKHRISENLIAEAGVSYGDGGIGGDLAVTYAKDDVTELSVGYSFVGDLGRLPETAGGRRRHQHDISVRGTRKLSDTASVFTETTMGLNNGFRMENSNNAFGMEFRPTDKWKLTALADVGLLDYSSSSDLKRTGVSLGADYSGEKWKFTSALETRFDRGRDRDVDFWAGRIGVSYKAAEDWTWQGSLDSSISVGEGSGFRRAQYFKATGAGVYRPVDNDSVNAIFKYVYVSDLSPESQLGSDGYNNQPRHRSHILSADVNYVYSERLTLGAKVAQRYSEYALDRSSDTFVDNRTSLGIIRADYKLTKDWELLVEGRIFEIRDVDRELSGLAGLWYNVNDTVKVGAGYSWSKYSDDLEDFSENNRGWFINVSARF